ncbi:MAG: polysaccharide deacetylase family protein [Armatimonadia bacterium]
MSLSAKTVCLKVDVDTLEGYLEGVPRLLDIMERVGVPATYCVAMGPDRSGLAVRRVLIRRGFLGKMLRTRGAIKYGMKTMLYGTLLPAPRIAAHKPELLQRIADAGHEVIPHGWDHINWHDFLLKWRPEKVQEQLALACEEWERYLPGKCEAFASPGWQANETSVLAQEARGLRYAADTRGATPFFPLVEGRRAKVLQIPTTLPTLDELIGLPEVPLDEEGMLKHVQGLFATPPALSGEAGLRAEEWSGLHIFTLHTEVEGRTWATWFERLLRSLQEDGCEFVTLGALADRMCQSGAARTASLHQGTLPGRGGTVSCQAMGE